MPLSSDEDNVSLSLPQGQISTMEEPVSGLIGHFLAECGAWGVLPGNSVFLQSSQRHRQRHWRRICGCAAEKRRVACRET
jgi:hypothetical protein